MNRWAVLGLLVCNACGGETFVSEAFYRRDAAPPDSSAFDAPSSPDDGASSADAGADADARADTGSDANTCSIFDGGSWTCYVAGQPVQVKAPSQYCTDWGGVRMTPLVCQCKETYTCACLTLVASSPCQGGQVWHCDDTGGKLATWCAAQ